MLSFFAKNVILTLKNRIFVLKAVLAPKSGLVCKIPTSHVTRLSWVSINFYHGGSLLVPVWSQDHLPLPRYRGGVVLFSGGGGLYPDLPGLARACPKHLWDRQLNQKLRNLILVTESKGYPPPGGSFWVISNFLDGGVQPPPTPPHKFLRNFIKYFVYILDSEIAICTLFLTKWKNKMKKQMKK